MMMMMKCGVGYREWQQMMHDMAYTRVHITGKCASHDIAHFLMIYVYLFQV